MFRRVVPVLFTIFTSAPAAYASHCHVLLGGVVSEKVAAQALKQFEQDWFEQIPFLLRAQINADAEDSYFIEVEVAKASLPLLGQWPSHINGVPVHFVITNEEHFGTAEIAASALATLTTKQRAGWVLPTSDIIMARNSKGSYYVEAYLDIPGNAEAEFLPAAIDGIRIHYISSKTTLAKWKQQLQTASAALSAFANISEGHNWGVSDLSLERTGSGEYVLAVQVSPHLYSLKYLPHQIGTTPVLYYLEDHNSDRQITRAQATEALRFYVETFDSEAVVIAGTGRNHEGSYHLNVWLDRDAEVGFSDRPATVEGVPVAYRIDP